MERERWAEEQVEVERRLFADSLKRLEAEHLSRHREATQRMVQACSRATTLVERNEAIRTTMSKAGLAAWRRRMLLAMWRAWRDMYVRNRLARIEGDYRLRLRQRVEEEVRVERQDHAEALRERRRTTPDVASCGDEDRYDEKNDGRHHHCAKACSII